MENWTLQRVGFTEPVFSLQNHIPVIKIGRANEVHKQCLGKQISRLHLECHQYKQQDDRIYWKVMDPGSSSHVFVNGHMIAKQEMVPLNDRDLISLGGNHEINDVTGQKRMFLYRIHAPTVWDNVELSQLDPCGITQLDPNAETPPRIKKE